MRIFVALEPPEGFRKEIRQILDKCRQICPTGVKWVDIKKIHFTMQFIGSITQEQQQLLEAQLTSLFADMSSFKIYSPQIELIPRPKPGHLKSQKRIFPRLVWVNCNYNDKSIDKKVYLLREFLQENSMLSDKKPFRMHLTLGRIKRRLNDSQLEEISQLQLKDRSWDISEATLYESRLHQHGPEYIKLKTFKFQEVGNG